MWAQWGTHGNPIYLLVAALVAGIIGALIALPALRLSGIYLALATAAFAVTLDRWIWTLPPIRVFGLFTLGGSVLEPDLQPRDYTLAAIERISQHVADLDSLAVLS